MEWVVVLVFVTIVVMVLMLLRGPSRDRGLVRTVTDEELFGDDALDLEAVTDLLEVHGRTLARN